MKHVNLILAIIFFIILGCSTVSKRESDYVVPIRYHYDDPLRELWVLEIREDLLVLDDVEIRLADFDLSRLKRHSAVARPMPVHFIINVGTRSNLKQLTENVVRLIEAANQANLPYQVSLFIDGKPPPVCIRTSAVNLEHCQMVTITKQGCYIDGKATEVGDLLSFVSMQTTPPLCLLVSRESLSVAGGYILLHNLLYRLNQCDVLGNYNHFYSLKISKADTSKKQW